MRALWIAYCSTGLAVLLAWCFHSWIGSKVDSAGTALPATHYVTMNANGSFTPSSLTINEGDTVVWQGPLVAGVPASLGTTDAVSRIGAPGANDTLKQVCGVAAGGPNEGIISGGPYVGLNFYGPKRKGASGIHVLGPQGYGKIETTLASCALLENPLSADVEYVETATAVDAAMVTHRLCSKRVKDTLGTRVQWNASGDADAGNISQIVPSVWANPDIDGIVLRIRWRDLQKYNPVSNTIVTNWSDVDRELRKALETGKIVSIAIHAGEDIPDFIFTDFDPDPNIVGEPIPAASNVVPVWLKDYYDGSSIPPGCGTERRYGSPSDPNYIEKIKGLYDSLAAHLKDDARFFQALGYVKVTGLNLTTGEAMLPKRCLDAALSCTCNTQVWANAVHPYTPAALYTFYNDVENRILGAFNGEKSLHYMLIQDGFPRVKDQLNFFRDPSNPINSVGSGYPGPFEQTEQILAYARGGRFAHPGDPATLYDDLSTGKLFVTQHSGLKILGADELGGAAATCAQTAQHPLLSDARGKRFFGLYYNPGAIPALGGVGTRNCPNEWAVKDGYSGQVTGFQNVAGILMPGDIDSSLWNMTSASNAAYFEMYEEAAWRIGITRGTGPAAAPLDDGTEISANNAPYTYASRGVRFQKNLHEWSRQLHDRRRAISVAVVDPANQPYPNLTDPFPLSHRHTFDAPLASGSINNFWYINPGRCLGAGSAGNAVGTIRVNGRP